MRRSKKSKYLIEIRYFGKAKHQIKEYISDIDNRFNLRKGHKVPHITVIQPFTTHKQKFLISDFKKICSKYNKIQFTVDGFGAFPCFVVYAKIKPSDDLRRLQEELFTNLRSYCRFGKTYSSYKPHTTIALSMGFVKFFRIWFYLLRKPKPIFTNHVMRVTLLKDRKILKEYDIYTKKILNRNQSKSGKVLKNTFTKFKQSKNKRGT